MERSLSSFNLDRENEPVNTQNSGVVVTPKKEHYRDTLTNSLFNKDECCADESAHNGAEHRISSRGRQTETASERGCG